jgi:hypothetical protein
MKKLILSIVCFIAVSINVEAQGVKLGVKAGANFSDLNSNNIDTAMLVSYHFGALVEINVFKRLYLQPEALFSSQGAKISGEEDLKLNYISVPLLAKLYLISNRISIEAGPQFSFLINNNLHNTNEIEKFDFAVAGGLGVNITKSLFAQARYVVGLSDTEKDAEVKNRVVQLSLGYMF